MRSKLLVIAGAGLVGATLLARAPYFEGRHASVVVFGGISDEKDEQVNCKRVLAVLDQALAEAGGKVGPTDYHIVNVSTKVPDLICSMKPAFVICSRLIEDDIRYKTDDDYMPAFSVLRKEGEGYSSSLIALKSSGITEVEDLRQDPCIANGRLLLKNEGSLAGFHGVRSILQEHELDIDDFPYTFVDSYDNILQGLRDGVGAAGAVYTELLQSHDDMRQVEGSKQFPNERWLIRRGILDSEGLDRLVEGLNTALLEDVEFAKALRKLYGIVEFVRDV